MFKIGDRIAAYIAGTIDQRPHRVVGEVFNIDEMRGLMIYVDKDKPEIAAKWFVHPKQCRRLRKKKRREWWIDLQTMHVHNESWTGTIHVREVSQAQKALELTK